MDTMKVIKVEGVRWSDLENKAKDRYDLEASLSVACAPREGVRALTG